MKLFTIGMIVITIIMTSLTFTLSRHLKTSTEKIRVQQKSISNNIKNQAILGLKPSINIFHEKIILLNKDTLNIKYRKQKNPILLYYYSGIDCETCVEENIYLITKNFSINDSIDIIISSNRTNIRDLYLKSKVNLNKCVTYGILENIPSDRNNFFVFAPKNEQLLNVFYPEKGISDITIEYIRIIKELFIEKNREIYNIQKQ